MYVRMMIIIEQFIDFDVGFLALSRYEIRRGRDVGAQ